MDKIIIEESGVGKLLDLVNGGRARNLVKLYWFSGKTIEEISSEFGVAKSTIVSDIIVLEKIAKENLVAIQCVQCNNTFYTANHRLRVCPLCKEENLKKRNETVKENNRSVTPKKKKQKGVTDVHEIMRRMAEYNKKNGTDLDYGKYVALTGE